MSDATSSEQTPARPKSRALAALPLVLVLVVIGLISHSLLSGGDPSRLPSVLIGKPVPDFNLAAIAGLQNEAGAPVPGFSSAALKSGRVSIINIWGSWCAPCAAEHPQLVELAKEGVPLYGINYKGDTAEGARRFLTRHGNPFQAVGADQTGMTAIDFGVYGVPETFVIDGSGHIVSRYPGPLTAEIVATKIMPAIKKAENSGTATAQGS